MSPEQDGYVPAIARQLRPYILQMIVSHVLHAEDIDVRKLWDAFADVGVEAEGELFTFLLSLRQMDYFGAF